MDIALGPKDAYYEMTKHVVFALIGEKIDPRLFMMVYSLMGVDWVVSGGLKYPRILAPKNLREKFGLACVVAAGFNDLGFFEDVSILVRKFHSGFWKDDDVQKVLLTYVGIARASNPPQVGEIVDSLNAAYPRHKPPWTVKRVHQILARRKLATAG